MVDNFVDGGAVKLNAFVGVNHYAARWHVNHYIIHTVYFFQVFSDAHGAGLTGHARYFECSGWLGDCGVLHTLMVHFLWATTASGKGECRGQNK